MEQTYIDQKQQEIQNKEQVQRMNNDQKVI
jgi:hypothetical protein